MYLKVKKNNKNAKLPKRANLSDAGADVFYCGDYGIGIIPGENHVFDTGLSVEVPHGFALVVLNRSSMAAKRGLDVGACLIDPGYAGPLMIDLHNVGTEAQEIYPGDKIAQVIMVPVVHWLPIETEEI